MNFASFESTEQKIVMGELNEFPKTEKAEKMKSVRLHDVSTITIQWNLLSNMSHDETLITENNHFITTVVYVKIAFRV